ncbi:MAG TPA: ABC transporter substrate-binding protein, partial [Alphaproteobacteria bacterium]|nr:ABC transporter substrate-binding protein [Alphaproteobacteria bacterium]
LQALGTAAGEVMAEEYEKADAVGKKIFKSYMRARRQLIAHMRFGEQAYFNARSLAFKYLDNV